MKRIPSILLATVLAAATGVAAANTTLTVYTALEADQIKAYQAAFEKAHPDIRINGFAIRPASWPPSCWPRRTTPRPM